MATNEAERVLSNWIRSATSQPGVLSAGTDPSEWIADRFLSWWKSESIQGPIDDARAATRKIQNELEHLGGWDNPALGGAMHELIHLTDALNELAEELRIRLSPLSKDVGPALDPSPPTPES
jgi:hypothetical protein